MTTKVPISGVNQPNQQTEVQQTAAPQQSANQQSTSGQATAATQSDSMNESLAVLTKVFAEFGDQLRKQPHTAPSLPPDALQVAAAFSVIQNQLAFRL